MPDVAHHKVLAPAQTELLSAEMLHTGAAVTANTRVHELVQPLLLVTVTVYVPAVLTLMH